MVLQQILDNSNCLVSATEPCGLGALLKEKHKRYGTVYFNVIAYM